MNVCTEKLLREGAKRKATSIGVIHGQPSKQAVHRRHFGKELEANREIQSNIVDERKGCALYMISCINTADTFEFPYASFLLEQATVLNR